MYIVNDAYHGYTAIIKKKDGKDVVLTEKCVLVGNLLYVYSYLLFIRWVSETFITNINH